MQVYNTLTRKKEPFVPATPGKVNMYVCGITAYDYCHIGHARSAVVFDLLVRFLRHEGLDVTFVRNFTDVDDKIIKRANETGKDSREVAETFIQAFYEDMDLLNILRADIEPKATEHIPEMIALTGELIAKGHAYATPSGDVYFRVRSFEGYGKLSGRDIDDMRSGARVAPGEEKEDPLDFALWKAAKPGEPFWESPWGQGRPGWHLECSAMNDKHLSLPLDIHGGGQDLIFPHHENEIAQSEAASGTQFARYWMHNGFVQVATGDSQVAEKMSKSLGNFKTIRDILEDYLPETLRYFLLTKHYRSPIDFTLQAMDEAEKNLRRVYTCKAMLEEEMARAKRKNSPMDEEPARELEQLEEEWLTAMRDDVNSAAALGHVFGLVRLANRIAENGKWRKSVAAGELFKRMLNDLEEWGEVLGVFQQDSLAFLAELKSIRLKRLGVDVARVEELVAQRTEAKKAKDFGLADEIRDQIAELGIEVKDTPAGPEWDVS